MNRTGAFGQNADVKTIASDVFDTLRTAKSLIVLDHGRAGNGIFMRLFDQHPEVLVIPHVGYFPFHLTRMFDDRQHVSGAEVLDFLLNRTDLRYVSGDMSEAVATEYRRLGDDPNFPIDRALVRAVLGELLDNGSYFCKVDVVAAMHAAYAIGTGRDVSRVKYVLMNDQPLHYQAHLNVSIEQAHEDKRDGVGRSVFIHLVRDPRANFASLRHQMVREANGMYPFFLRGLLSAFRSVLYGSGTWCVFLLILEYTMQGSRELFEWRKRTSAEFIVVRNEDVNLRFVPTMESLAKRLGVQWFKGWSNPNYVPTAGGLPWRGASAYSNTYQQLREEKIRRTLGVGGKHAVHGYRFSTDTVLNNEPADVSASIAGPNRRVTERWRSRLSRHEIAFLEAVYYEELADLDYETMYVYGSVISRIKGFLRILFPLSGELLAHSWIMGRLRAGVQGSIRLMLEMLLLSIFYVCSRLTVFRLYFMGIATSR